MSNSLWVTIDQSIGNKSSQLRYPLVDQENQFEIDAVEDYKKAMKFFSIGDWIWLLACEIKSKQV